MARRMPPDRPTAKPPLLRALREGRLIPPMVDDQTLRALATALPEVVESPDGGQLAFSVAGKGLAWSYLARPTPKAGRVLVPGVIAVRCLIETKQMLIEAAPDRFFDDAHYRGYPAVLVRLERIDADELAGLLRTAWTLVAPKALVNRHS